MKNKICTASLKRSTDYDWDFLKIFFFGIESGRRRYWAVGDNVSASSATLRRHSAAVLLVGTLVLVHLFVGTKGYYLSYLVNKSMFTFVVNWKLNWTPCTSWVRKAALVVKLVVDEEHYCRATLPGWSLVSLPAFGLHCCSSVNAVLSASLLNVGAVPSLVS